MFRRRRSPAATLFFSAWLLALCHGTAILAEEASPNTDHAELRTIYEADQADRSGDMHEADWQAISRRDAERRARVMELVEAGEAQTAADYFHAAMVFQHGEGAEDIRIARDWAARAVELAASGSEIESRAKWLFAAATDRHLHRLGKPQIYGTQYLRDPDGGPWTQEPFDRDAVTPEERAEHGVASEEERQARLDQMNAELRKRGLLDADATSESESDSESDGD